MKASQKLAALAEQELPRLLNQVIIADGEKYRLFGSYVMRKVPQGYSITYNDDLVAVFSSTKSAVAWCIADKNRQYNLAREIQHLDFNLMRLRNDVEVRSNLAKNSKGMFWETVQAKADHKKQQSRHIQNELSKCVNLAKYWQLRGSNNETARTGVNSPYKTNR